MEGRAAPEMLLGGDHDRVRTWRLKQSLGRTWMRRPEMLSQRRLNERESRLLRKFQSEFRLTAAAKRVRQGTLRNIRIRESSDEQHHSRMEAEQLPHGISGIFSGGHGCGAGAGARGPAQRLQAFEGVVIAKRNRGLNSSFTVRKISHGEGVERVFQTHSPMIAGVTVKRRGDVRRAKLYYLRQRRGRSARIREKL